MRASCATIIGWSLKRQLCKELKIHWVPSKGSKVCLIVGDNATGKSLFRRIVSYWCQKDREALKKSVEMIGLSMEARSGGSMMGIARAMVYGDESWNATGVNTAHTVTTAIKTSKSRTSPNVVFWDEPDTGLSDAYAADVGRRIATFAKEAPETTLALFVVTHRKALVQHLLPAKPHILFFGENQPKTVEEWLTRPVVPADLEELSERGITLFRRIHKLEEEARAKK